MREKIDDRSFEAAKKRFNSNSFIDNVCLSYRHDFGLLSEEDKEIVRSDCKEWMRSIVNNWKHFKEEEKDNNGWDVNIYVGSEQLIAAFSSALSDNRSDPIYCKSIDGHPMKVLIGDTTIFAAKHAWKDFYLSREHAKKILDTLVSIEDQGVNLKSNDACWVLERAILEFRTEPILRYMP
jgi:hypothetical protein